MCREDDNALYAVVASLSARAATRNLVSTPKADQLPAAEARGPDRRDARLDRLDVLDGLDGTLVVFVLAIRLRGVVMARARGVKRSAKAASGKARAAKASSAAQRVARSATTGRYTRTVRDGSITGLHPRLRGAALSQPNTTPAPTRQPKVAGTTQWDQFEKSLLDALRRAVHVQLRRAAVADLDPAAIGDPEDLAAAMVAALPASHPFDEVTGPFYDTTGLTTWLSVSRQALHQRLRGGSILGCPLDDGSIVYPAWQFLDNGAIVPGVSDLLKVLGPATNDTWQMALWLSAPNDELDGIAPRDWLRSNRSREPVVTLAKQTAARWAH
jgi:hypothetical protein